MPRLPCPVRYLFLAALCLFPPGVSVATGSIVQFVVSGTYDTLGNTIFGESGSSVAYSYSIEYDTSLDTNHLFFGTGSSLGSRTTSHEWHGYSASGILSSSVTFGSKTFMIADLDPRTIEAGVTADFWLDVDLSSGMSPNLALMYFNDTTHFEGLLEISAVESSQTSIYIDPYSRIFDFFSGGSNRDVGVGISVVPESSAVGLITCGLVGMVTRRRRF